MHSACEQSKSTFLPFLTVRRSLGLEVMPECQDLEFFMPTTDTTNHFTPCTCVQGNELAPQGIII